MEEEKEKLLPLSSDETNKLLRFKLQLDNIDELQEEVKINIHNILKNGDYNLRYVDKIHMEINFVSDFEFKHIELLRLYFKETLDIHIVKVEYDICCNCFCKKYYVYRLLSKSPKETTQDIVQATVIDEKTLSC